MSVLEDMNTLSSAEDFFEFLDVPYDPEVVHVCRLHILRRMGQYLYESEQEGAFEGHTDDEVKTLCHDHLSHAYHDFIVSTPIAERLFKVHQDAAKPKAPKQKPFVPLTALTGEKSASGTGKSK